MPAAYLLMAAFVAIMLWMHFKRKAKRFNTGPLAKKEEGWIIEHSEGTPKRPTVNGAGWFVDIPLIGQGFIGSIKWYDEPALRVGSTIRLHGRIVGSGKVIAREYPDRQATATLIVQRKDDQETGRGQYETYRQYSAKMIPLVEGPFDMTVTLAHDQFGGVMGSHDAEAFAETMKEALCLQIGMGSAGGRAHSVHADGPVRFYLDGITVS